MVERLDTGRLNELAEFFVLDYLKKQGVAPDSVVCILFVKKQEFFIRL